MDLKAAVKWLPGFLTIALASLCLTSAPAFASGGPVIEAESVSHLSSTDATLEAEINTGGAATHYQLRLEYGCGIAGEACSQACLVPGPCPMNPIVHIPLPGGDLPASSEIEHVSLDLHDAGVTLQPSTKYRYSIEATNNAGTAEGPGQVFTTPSAGPADAVPSIEGTSASGIVEHDATLEAQINPEGLETTYTFQIAQSPACLPPPMGYMPCFQVEVGDLPSASLPGGFSASSVSLDLASAGMTLQPSTTYSYRVVATNSAGPTVDGPTRTFSTPPTAKPSIESVSVTDITEHDATLEAQINPNGLETTYEFHLTSPACQSGWPEVGPCFAISGFPLPNATIAAGFGDQTVRLDISSAGETLQPGTWYEYAITASNADGEVTGHNVGEGPGIGRNFAGGGGEQNFKTLSASHVAPGAPSIDSESATGVTEHDATLEAQITPVAPGAYYQFQLVREPSEYQTEIDCPLRSELKATDGCQGPEVQGVTIGYMSSGAGSQAVSIDAASLGLKLEPSTTYHYRVLAATKIQTEDTLQWETPPVYGADQTFTTASSRARPLGSEETPSSTGRGETPSNTTGAPGASAGSGATSPSTPTLSAPVESIKPRPLTRAQKLKRALELCLKKHGRRRAACERLARKRYGPAAKHKR